MPNEPQIPKWICNESHPRTENEPPQKDVIEARELAEYADGLAAGLTSTKVSQIAVTLRQLCDEVERLRGLVGHMEFPRGD